MSKCTLSGVTLLILALLCWRKPVKFVRITISDYSRTNKDVEKHYPITLLQMFHKYYYTTEDVVVSHCTNPKFIFSYSTIPPNFHKLKRREHPKMVLNLPRSYRFFGDYNMELLKEFPVNLIQQDLGPASKVLGLCAEIQNLPEVIVYGDDDIEYNWDGIKDLACSAQSGVIVSNSGGVYVDEYQNLSSVGLDLLEWYRPVGFHMTRNDVTYGFGAVAITRGDLSKVCEIAPKKLFDCPFCFMIDDEFLSWIYNSIGLLQVSNRGFKTMVSTIGSDENSNSNRHLYPYLKKWCLKCLNEPYFVFNENLKIVSFFGTKSSVHDVSEYTETYQRFTNNHFKFAMKHGYKYDMIKNITTKQTHWMKWEIINQFLEQCQANDVLFYTDLDFLFVNDLFPKFKEGKSIIMSKGCEVDFNQYMTGNMLIRCDKDLLSFMKVWLAGTEVLHQAGELVDDQLAFNILSTRIFNKLQVEPFMAYDTCVFDPKKVLGIHFPGTDKLNRLKMFEKSYI